MLDQIRPPTDSLYKFLAIAGLAIFLVAGWAHFRVDLQMIKLDSKAELVIARTVRNQAEHMKKLLAEAANDNTIATADAAKDRLREIVSSQHEGTQEDNLSLATLAWERGSLVRDNEPERTLLKISVGAGLVLSLIGFVLWYIKIQRPTDAILKLQWDAAKNSTS